MGAYSSLVNKWAARPCLPLTKEVIWHKGEAGLLHNNQLQVWADAMPATHTQRDRPAKV
jgi:hypothetical protein